MVLYLDIVKKCALQKSEFENPHLPSWGLGSVDLLLNVIMKEKGCQVEKMKIGILRQCSLICVFTYNANVYVGLVYIVFISLAPTLKLCNFVTVRVEINLVETIFVENFTWNIFVLAIFFEKMRRFREKREILDFGTSSTKDRVVGFFFARNKGVKLNNFRP